MSTSGNNSGAVFLRAKHQQRDRRFSFVTVVTEGPEAHPPAPTSFRRACVHSALSGQRVEMPPDCFAEAPGLAQRDAARLELWASQAAVAWLPPFLSRAVTRFQAAARPAATRTSTPQAQRPRARHC